MQKQWGKIFLLACMLNGKPYARVFWHGKGRLPWFLIWATGWRKSYKVKVLSNYPQDVTLHNLLSHYAIEYYKNNVLYYHYINFSFLPFWSNNRFFIILRACFHITWTCSDLWVVENGGHFNFLAMKSQKGKQQIHVFNPKYMEIHWCKELRCDQGTTNMIFRSEFSYTKEHLH